MGAFGAVLVCDDVRRDTNNKDILIGVYSADIIVSAVPNWLTLAFYLEYLPTEIGDQELELRFGLTASGLAGAHAKIHTDDLSPIAMPMAGLQMLVEKETELVIEVSFDNKQTWQVLKRKKVRVGPLPPATPLPTLLGGPPGNG